MALDFFAGCLGGCAGVLVGYPLDTVKVLLQTQDSSKAVYRGTFHCIRTVVKQESFRGLYKGMSSPLTGLAAINAIIFGTYGNVQRATSNPSSLSSHALAGATAGFVQSIITGPMELVKTRIQIQEQVSPTISSHRWLKPKPLYNNPWDCLCKVAKAEGVRGIFSGLGITIMRDAPAFAIYFSTFEYLTKKASANSSGRVSNLELLIFGGLAGVLSWIATYPIDVIKSKVQTDGMKGSRQFTGTWDCIRKTYHGDGIWAFAKGLNSTIIRAFPTNAATFAVFTWVFMFCERRQIESRVAPAHDDLHMENKLHTIAAYIESCVL